MNSENVSFIIFLQWLGDSSFDWKKTIKLRFICHFLASSISARVLLSLPGKFLEEKYVFEKLFR